jgi:thiamine-phosphate pyrophosphorylase
VEKDLGKGNREKNETVRSVPLDLLRANLKRSQEALRSLEEFSKLVHPTASRKFKKIRYACYKIEEERLG